MEFASAAATLSSRHQQEERTIQEGERSAAAPIRQRDMQVLPFIGAIIGRKIAEQKKNKKNQDKMNVVGQWMQELIDE